MPYKLNLLVSNSNYPLLMCFYGVHQPYIALEILTVKIVLDIGTVNCKIICNTKV